MCAKEFINFFHGEKIEKILTLLSFILLLSSFVKTIVPFSFLESPNLYRLIIGSIFTLCFILFFFTNLFSTNVKSKISFKKAVIIKYPHIEISIQVGAIQDSISNENFSVGIVLPANSSLDDQCINDSNSALGAFVLKKIPNNKELFINELSNYKKNHKDFLPIGTSFLLSENYSLNHKIIITCVSEITDQKGVVSYPENIPLCYRQIFEISSKNKITHLITPIIGSGHGGINVSEALHLIIFSAAYYSKIYHMIKKITILVHSSNKDTIANEFCILNRIS